MHPTKDPSFKMKPLPPGVEVRFIAADMGITPAQVRKIVSTHHVKPIGQRWKAKRYSYPEVLRHAQGNCDCGK